jgi:RNA polymerase sigma-70 factor (ECF subfamily)
VPGTSTSSRQARTDAFRTHVEPEIDVLLRVGQTLTGSWTDAEDLVQDTLIRAWKAIDRFDGAHPRAWLLTILRNAHRNSLRRQRPDLIDDTAVLDGARPAFGASRPRSAQDTVDDTVLRDDLETAVAGLDERFRTVLLLIDVDQLTYAEVAEVLELPIGTVMSRLSRARDRVRKQLRPAVRGPGSPPSAAAGDDVTDSSSKNTTPPKTVNSNDSNKGGSTGGTSPTSGPDGGRKP